MSYEMCLEKAGAVVHCFKEFGSYQGDWYAKVTYNGETGWITGCYGSCSGCDAFEAEFGYGPDGCEKHYYLDPDCEACKQILLETDKKYADFGCTYLDGTFSQEIQEEVLRKQIAENSWYKEELEEILKFVEENR